ncbi:GGDEF domain-containing protein [Cohnella mopanensis]|uniref:GGDEF domain-containing protein n=1 Tax=Cohnella mopanensis TaxID=2911966 RepID=UPI001EF8BF9F|nr:sensor domain-containing diguanylate cyclase [Cohnella mopanensis]
MIPLEFAITFLIVLAGSLVRFYLSPFWNRLLLCLVLFAMVEAISQSGFGELEVILYGLFVLLVSYSFSMYGALASVILMAALTYVKGGLGVYPMAVLVFAGVSGLLFHQQKQRKLASDGVWLMQLYKQSRHLSILKEISIAIQSTMEVGKLLHIILTAITAGYGLGFNRALLFLVDDKGSNLQGAVGIGSMTKEQGISTWNNVVSRRMNLGDFIALMEDAQFRDIDLIKLLRDIEIPLNSGNHIFHQALTEKKPIIVRELDWSDTVQRQLAETFQMTSFAIVPMLNQGNMVGVIVVDNNVNHQPLEMEEIDSIVPLAAQASVAIENSRLYERSQRMSITDGLTGLYNQRFYQDKLQELAQQSERNDSPLSLMIADIDFFKHYNDTNGHLEGNNTLIGVAKIIANTVSGPHFPCRFGGEEFVALLPGATQEATLAIAEKIRSAVEQHPFHNREAQPSGKLTICIGVAFYRAGMSVQQLQDLADSALYEAKRNGKNRVIVHEEGAIRP